MPAASAQPAQLTPEAQAIEALQALFRRMLTMEKDPDYVSICAIAKAHGYKTTGTLWYNELRAVMEAFNKLPVPKTPVVAPAPEPQNNLTPFPSAQILPFRKP